ncbi:MAG: hypothetical protein DRN07_01055 [Thermoplasmata archaeon]|nr:MAG: hypothetical protein DRN07_01055 [Thermoplasmata archaeon]
MQCKDCKMWKRYLLDNTKTIFGECTIDGRTTPEYHICEAASNIYQVQPQQLFISRDFSHV